MIIVTIQLRGTMNEWSYSYNFVDQFVYRIKARVSWMHEGNEETHNAKMVVCLFESG